MSDEENTYDTQSSRYAQLAICIESNNCLKSLEFITDSQPFLTGCAQHKNYVQIQGQIPLKRKISWRTYKSSELVCGNCPQDAIVKKSWRIPLLLCTRNADCTKLPKWRLRKMKVPVKGRLPSSSPSAKHSWLEGWIDLHEPNCFTLPPQHLLLLKIVDPKPRCTIQKRIIVNLFSKP